MILGMGFSEISFGVGITIIVVLIGLWIAQCISNSRQPLQHFPVKVVAKRTAVSGGMNNMPNSTDYFVTFEHENGARVEFPVSVDEYGMIAERDRGTIGLQGTWFKGFQRTKTTQRRN